MQSKYLAVTGCLAAALALGVTACGDDSSDGGSSDKPAAAAPAKSVTVYSSLPLQGASRDQGIAVVNGAKLALEQAGGKAGDVSVKYTSLDDSTPGYLPEVMGCTHYLPLNEEAGDDPVLLFAAAKDGVALYLGCESH